MPSGSPVTQTPLILDPGRISPRFERGQGAFQPFRDDSCLVRTLKPHWGRIVSMAGCSLSSATTRFPSIPDRISHTDIAGQLSFPEYI